MMHLKEHLEAIKQLAGKSYSSENAFVEMSLSSKIIIDEKADLMFNCSWLQHDPFPSVLALGVGASLIVKDNFKIYSGAKVFINKNASLVLGSGYINNNALIHCFEKIEIGENVAIADNVSIRDSDNHSISSNQNHVMTQPVYIGNYVWIGLNVTILKGVHIGDGAVIAAGAVVTRPIPAGCLAAGVPARVIKSTITWD